MSSLAGIPKYDLAEFNQRWLKARLGAFRKIEPEKFPVTASELESEFVDRFFSQFESTDKAVAEKSKEDLLRAVFENSRKLALSLSKNLGITFEVQDFQALLEKSDIPCVQGEWTARPHVRVLNRRGCDFCVTSGSNACDYWREALDGLVMGLGEKERITRHASVRHGDEICIDVFYSDSKENNQSALAWGSVPDHMALELFEMAEFLKYETGVTIDLKGFKEGVLYFEFKSTTDTLCGSGKNPMQKFQAIIAEKFPGLGLKDVTPQAVLGTEA